ncbi:MAG: hypothetical protein R3F49_19470 [Planctomycetota bacterium]
MHGSIALSHGVLYIGRSHKAAAIQAFDLDGRPLQPRIEFEDAVRGRSSVAGLDVDADRRVWVADDAAAKLRGFTLFGRSIAELGGGREDRLDVRGALGVPVAVRARGSDDELVLLVASGGRRRYALQFLRPFDAGMRALPSLGDIEEPFDDLADVHWAHGRDGEPDYVLACERRAQRLQIYRDGRFHYAVSLRGRPEAAVRLADGRFVVALGDLDGARGAVVLLGTDGRPLRTIADASEVDHPSGLALLDGDGEGDRGTRLWIVDREGARVQLFTLDGRGWGEFPSAIAAR